MKAIEFGESQMDNLHLIARELFDDKTDPRCIGYKRVLNRPKIQWLNVMAWVLIPVISICVLFCGFHLGKNSFRVKLIVFTVFNVVYVGLTLRKAIICSVRIYQRYAPDSLRNKCRFEPSCSEYMVLAINKYGVLKGMIRGIKRLKRCNINNGGIDLP